MKELKPCPFCGGEAVLQDYGVGTGGWMISCKNNCGVLKHAYCSKPTCNPAEIHAEIRVNVITAWNTRPSPWIKITPTTLPAEPKGKWLTVNQFDTTSIVYKFDEKTWLFAYKLYMLIPPIPEK